MKLIDKYLTSDGKEFTAYKAAEQHAKDRYKAQLDHVARQIFREMRDAKLPTPTVLCGWLDDPKHREALTGLFAMKDDLHLEDDRDLPEWSE